MPRTKLSVADSVTHALGQKAFEFRVKTGEWRAVNIAVIAFTCDDISVWHAAPSDPLTSEHSEEVLLDLFDETLETLEADAFTDLCLYTELAPCTYLHGQAKPKTGVKSSPEHRHSALPPELSGTPWPANVTVTFERKSCASKLLKRFADLQVFYTVDSIDELRGFLSFSHRLAQMGEDARNIQLHAIDLIANKKQATRLLATCPARHNTFIWMRPGWSGNMIAAALNASKCPVVGCGRDTVVFGCQPLDAATVEAMTTHSHTIVRTIYLKAG